MTSFPRLIVATLVLACAFFTAVSSARTGEPADDILEGLRTGHPRILVDGDTFTSIRERALVDSRLAAWLDVLRSVGEGMLSEKPVRPKPEGRIFTESRVALDRITTLALLYKLDGDRRFLDRCWRECEAVAQLATWRPEVFLDTAQMTAALAIGYDWLYAEWDEKQRSLLSGALVTKSLIPARRAYAEVGVNTWTERENNWNQVCNGALVVGALAVASEMPEIARKTLQEALKRLPLGLGMYAPDGGYREGIDYWALGTSYTVLAVSALESALGHDFGLSASPGFAETALFPVYLRGPTGRWFNAGDSSGAFTYGEFALMALAERFGQPKVAALSAEIADPHPFDLLFYHTPRTAPAPLPTYRHWQRVDMATIRGSWDDPSATWVAFKGGRPDESHAQADLGSFVMDSLGHSWVVDMGRGSYNLPGYFDVTGNRWNYLRNRAEAHNTLIINPGNGPDQIPSGRARIVRFSGDDTGFQFGIIDLTAAYRPQVTSVLRGIALVGGSDVVVRDEVTVPAPVDLRWAIQTRAEIETVPGSRVAVLKIGEKRLKARIVSPAADAGWSVRPLRPLASSPQPFGQQDDMQVRTLSIRLTGFTGGAVVVHLSPQKPGIPPEIPGRPLSRW